MTWLIRWSYRVERAIWWLILVGWLGLIVFVLVGCAGYPVAVAAHAASDPATGWPLNERCDATADFAGAGWGWENGGNRVYITLGHKVIRQCGAPDQAGLGASALYIHEFRGGGGRQLRGQGAVLDLRESEPARREDDASGRGAGTVDAVPVP